MGGHCQGRHAGGVGEGFSGGCLPAGQPCPLAAHVVWLRVSCAGSGVPWPLASTWPGGTLLLFRVWPATCPACLLLSLPFPRGHLCQYMW